MEEVVDRVKHIITDLSEKLGNISKGNFRLQNGMEEYYTGAYAPILSALSEITTDLSKNMSEIQDISLSSEEEAKGVRQITQGVDQISSVVQSNTATVEETAAASEELTEQANKLKDLVAGFQLKD